MCRRRVQYFKTSCTFAPMDTMDIFSEENYRKMIGDLFVRFPSFQNTGSGAYKPGLDRMEFFDSLAGHPHRRYASVHVAGTNGKGSVSNMMASVLASCGLKVGLYTSPHISDFRERARIIDGSLPDSPLTYISEREVWDFVRRWNQTFDHLEMSFFEITTAMAFTWFADRQVDVAVIETGLGGRLDSTNIITPVLSIITNIGLDHCDMLGNTLGEIAFEKAGIIKPGVPAVVGESDPETDPVFERKVLYSNLSDNSVMGALLHSGGSALRDRGLIVFADKTEPAGWDRHQELLAAMDLQGEYQEKNLRTVLASADVLKRESRSGLSGAGAAIADALSSLDNMDRVADAIIHTASRMDFHGRWEKVSDCPYIICDIGHNAHGLKYNFHQLSGLLESGKADSLTVVYGTVADKDFESVFPLMPENARYIFTNASGRRAMPAEELMKRYVAFCGRTGRQTGRCLYFPSVRDAVMEAMAEAEKNISQTRPAIYIGGSTYVVSEALACLSGILHKGQ